MLILIKIHYLLSFSLFLDVTSSAEERKISEVETSGAPLKIFQPVPVVANLASMHMTVLFHFYPMLLYPFS